VLVGSNAYRVRRQEKLLQSMYLAGVPTPWYMLRQPIHLRRRGHSNLVRHYVADDSRASSVVPGKTVIHGMWRVGTTDNPPHAV